MITLQITGVGTEPILANARHYDIEGNPRRKIREMLFQELGIKEGDGFLTGHKNGRRRKLATYPERLEKWALSL